MRVVIQRVKDARVEVDGQISGAIGLGLLVLLGIARTDSKEDADYLVEKVLHIRIFP
ncbi:MAG: D-aminoacyl-tRNA deacylase, partial [Bryobacteraceae bacterium]